MQIDFDKLGEREPALAILMIAAGQKDAQAPYALVIMALDKARQNAERWRDDGIDPDFFIRELYELAAEYVSGGDATRG